MAGHGDLTDLSNGQLKYPVLSIRCSMPGAAQATKTFDLDALAVTQGEPKTIPANAKVVGAYVECETALTFQNGVTQVALVVGITGTTNGFLLTGNLASLTAGQYTDLGGLGTLINRIRANSAPALEAVATASGGSAIMSDVLTGVFWIHLEYDMAQSRRS